MKSIFSVTVGAVLLALGNLAGAAEPLTADEMDSVTAGATAGALAASLTVGDVLSETVAKTHTFASAPGLVAVAKSSSAGVAASVFFPAASASASAAAASLP